MPKVLASRQVSREGYEHQETVISKEDSGCESNQQTLLLPLSFSWCLTPRMPCRELAILGFSSFCAHMELSGLKLCLGGCSG